MKAILLFESYQLFVTEDGETVEIHMDLYKLADQTAETSFRFSWIAFATSNPLRRVLFDSHPPKGPHFHLDQDPEGQPFKWLSVSDAVRLFREKVSEHFGELREIPDEGGQL